MDGFRPSPSLEEAARWIQQRARVQFLCDACNLPHLVPESLPSRKFPPHIRLVLELHFLCEVDYIKNGISDGMGWDDPEDIHALYRFKFVNLLDMNSQSSRGIQPPRTHIALEVLLLLMLH